MERVNITPEILTITERVPSSKSRSILSENCIGFPNASRNILFKHNVLSSYVSKDMSKQLELRVLVPLPIILVHLFWDDILGSASVFPVSVTSCLKYARLEKAFFIFLINGLGFFSLLLAKYFWNRISCHSMVEFSVFFLMMGGLIG